MWALNCEERENKRRERERERMKERRLSAPVLHNLSSVSMVNTQAANSDGVIEMA